MRRFLAVMVVGLLSGVLSGQEAKVDFPAEMARIHALKKAGQQALDASKFDVAVQSYQEAIAAQTNILGADNPETLDTVRLLAGVFEKQERWGDAYALREALVDAQRRDGGKLTDEVVWAAVNAAFNWGAELYGKVDSPPKDLAAARDLVRRLRERSEPFEGKLVTNTALDMVAQWNEAWTEYRSGQPQQAINALKHGISCFPQNAWGHMAMALFCSQAGEKELARDWYLAACEGATEAAGPDKEFDVMKQKAEALVFLGEEPPKVEPTKCQEVYDRLLAAYPNMFTLYVRRGMCAARVGRTEQAIADFRKALELRPDDAWNWYNVAIASLFSGQVDEYKKTCAGMHAKFADSPYPFDRHLLIIVYSLAPNPEIDGAAMLEMAKRPDRTDDSRVARVLYRCGRFDEALQELAAKPEGIIEALTQFARGDKAAAKRALIQSKGFVQSRRDPATNFFAPGVSIMEIMEVEILFREAEQLLAPSVEPFFDKIAQVLIGDWTATGTISEAGANAVFKAGDTFTMVASLRPSAGGKAIVGTEKLTITDRPDASIESFVVVTWDPVDDAVWILAPWSDGSSEIGNLTLCDANGFSGTYTIHLPDGRQETCEIAMELESKDKFSWVLKTGPRAGQCLSTWQRTDTPASDAGN